MIAGTAAILILIVLSDLHVYWARGGKAGKGEDKTVETARAPECRHCAIRIS